MTNLVKYDSSFATKQSLKNNSIKSAMVLFEHFIALLVLMFAIGGIMKATNHPTTTEEQIRLDKSNARNALLMRSCGTTYYTDQMLTNGDFDKELCDIAQNKELSIEQAKARIDGVIIARQGEQIQETNQQIGSLNKDKESNCNLIKKLNSNYNNPDCK